MRILSQSTKGLRQHRAIRQEVSDRIFTPIQSLENEGILYVFLVFQTEEVGQKDGGDSQTQLCGVALKDFYRCGRSGNSSLVCYACVVYDLSGAAHGSGGCAHSGYSLSGYHAHGNSVTCTPLPYSHPMQRYFCHGGKIFIQSNKTHALKGHSSLSTCVILLWSKLKPSFLLLIFCKPATHGIFVSCLAQFSS